MEDKILEILKQMQESIMEIKDSQEEMKSDIKDIKAKLDITYDQVARISEDVVSIKDDMSTVETVTAKNWADIVKLKSIKKMV